MSPYWEGYPERNLLVPHLTARARLVALTVALVLPMLAWSSTAHADDLIPTQIYANVYGGTHIEDTTVTMTANVQRTPGGNSVIGHGTVTFRDSDGNVLASGLVPANEGSVQATIPKPAGSTTYYADYHGADGYADSTTSTDFTPQNLKPVYITPQPTLLKIGTGLLPTLTLTMAVSFKRADGTGVAGYGLRFYMLCDGSPSRTCGVSIPICTAVSDANGLASCKGSGAFGAIVSILTGGVKVTGTDSPTAPTDLYGVWTSEKFPVIATG